MLGIAVDVDAIADLQYEWNAVGVVEKSRCMYFDSFSSEAYIGYFSFAISMESMFVRRQNDLFINSNFRKFAAAAFKSLKLTS